MPSVCSVLLVFFPVWSLSDNEAIVYGGEGSINSVGDCPYTIDKLLNCENICAYKKQQTQV